jgi:hypothetical protein
MVGTHGRAPLQVFLYQNRDHSGQIGRIDVGQVSTLTHKPIFATGRDWNLVLRLLIPEDRFPYLPNGLGPKP